MISKNLFERNIHKSKFPFVLYVKTLILIAVVQLNALYVLMDPFSLSIKSKPSIE